MVIKHGLLIIFSFWMLFTSAQEAAEISIEHADELRFNRREEGYQRLIGNVILKQDSTYLYCDSAHFYNEVNRAIAYSNVKMVSDSSTLTCLELTYNGNTKQGIAMGSVVLQSRNSNLFTDTLYFDRATNEAFFNCYGALHREGSRITAIRGSYFMDDDRAEFADSVRIVDGTTRVQTDSLIHYSEKRRTFLYARSVIELDSSVIESDMAQLDHDRDFYQFWGSVDVNRPGTHLEGDSLIFDEAQREFWGYGRVSWVDSLENRGLESEFVHVNDSLDWAFATGQPILKLIEPQDTLFLSADSLFLDGLSEEQRGFQAWHHVLFYRGDVQGRCDSMSYRGLDSTMEMFRQPILWAEEFQITADSIRLHFKNAKPHQFHATGHGFTVGQKSESRFDQIKGRNITGYFNHEGALYEILVQGNGETIYFGKDESEDLVGMDRTECSSMRIGVENRELANITFYNQPIGIFIPMREVDSTNEHLKDFEWRIAQRPRSKQDLNAAFWNTTQETQNP